MKPAVSVEGAGHHVLLPTGLEALAPALQCRLQTRNVIHLCQGPHGAASVRSPGVLGWRGGLSGPCQAVTARHVDDPWMATYAWMCFYTYRKQTFRKRARHVHSLGHLPPVLASSMPPVAHSTHGTAWPRGL